MTVQPECFLGHELLARVDVVELNEPWAVRRLHIATARGRSASPITSALMKQLLDQPREEAVE